MSKRNKLFGLFSTKKREIHPFHHISETLDIEKFSYYLSEEKNNIPPPKIIGVGQAGIRIVAKTNEILKKNQVPSYVAGIGLENDKNPDPSIPVFHRNDIMQEKKTSFLQIYDALDPTKTGLGEIIQEFQKLQPHDNLVFVVFGAGATGVGGSLRICFELMQRDFLPVPVLVMPFSSEPVERRYNAAVAIYRYSLGPLKNSMNLPLIVIEQDDFITTENISITDSFELINNRIAQALGETILAPFNPSKGLEIAYREFKTLFTEIRGLGSLVFLNQSRKSWNDFDEFLKENLSYACSLKCDPFSATRGYLALQASKGDFLLRDYKKGLEAFEETDVYWHLSEHEQETIIIRGILTGIAPPKQIREFLDKVETMKIRLVGKEKKLLEEGKAIHNIDKIQGAKANQDLSISEEELS